MYALIPALMPLMCVIATELAVVYALSPALSPVVYALSPALSPIVVCA